MDDSEALLKRLYKNRERTKQWRLRFPEKAKKLKQDEYLRHRDAYLQRSKKRREGPQRNRILTYLQQYRLKQRREKQIDYNKRYYVGAKCWINFRRRITFQRAREELFHVLNQHCCRMCGYHDKRALQFDHINGGGTHEHKHVFLNKRVQFYMYYVLNPELAKKTLQVLCANCNILRKFEFKSV